MLQRQEIVEMCKHLDFPPQEYCLGYGGALVLYGIKESTPDIDLVVSSSLFDQLAKDHAVQVANLGEPYIRFNEEIEIFKNSELDPRVYIEDIPVASLPKIIQEKMKLGRSKDIEDIKRIKRFIESRTAE